MEFLNITESKRKVAYLRSNEGAELILFWEKEVRVRFYDRDMAVIDLLRMSQGDKTAMEYVAAAEDQARLCRADSVPIKGQALQSMPCTR